MLQQISGYPQRRASLFYLSFSYLSLALFVLLVLASHWLDDIHGQLLQHQHLGTDTQQQAVSFSGFSEFGSVFGGFGSFGFGNIVIAQFSAMTLLMLIIWYWQAQAAKRPLVADNNQNTVWLVLATGVLARLILIGVEPYTSNDVDRYLFDGRIALTGLDPYQISHDHPALAQLRELWQPPAEHAKYPTLYPPLALAMFAVAASFGVSFSVESAQLVWQLMLTTASIASLYFAYLLLKAHNKLQHLALVALSPILIIETGVGLHLDAFSSLAVVAALYYWQRGKMALTGLCIGLGVLCKILPLVLLMPLVLANFSWRRAITMTTTAIAVIVTGYAITLALGFYPVGSIDVFFQKWRFAAPLFDLLSQLDQQSFVIALTAIVLSLVAVVAALASRQQTPALKTQAQTQKQDGQSEEKQLQAKRVIQEKTIDYTLSQPLIIACQLALVIPLLISPVLFPWYLMPLAVLLALSPNAALIIVLSVMPLTYEVLNQFICCRIWQPAQWPIDLLACAYIFAFVSLVYWGIKRAKLNQAVSHHVKREQQQISFKRASEA